MIYIKWINYSPYLHQVNWYRNLISADNSRSHRFIKKLLSTRNVVGSFQHFKTALILNKIGPYAYLNQAFKIILFIYIAKTKNSSFMNNYLKYEWNVHMYQSLLHLHRTICSSLPWYKEQAFPLTSAVASTNLSSPSESNKLCFASQCLFCSPKSRVK